MAMTLPRYPIYIPSKGRVNVGTTMKFLNADGVPYFVVVEPPERDAYVEKYGADKVLVLPFADLGQGSIPARNWIKDHATAAGFARHWQLDDNIKDIRRWYKGQRIPCNAGPALAAVEDFVDRYDNVAVAGLNYQMFCVGNAPPFYLNVHVYSCTLVLNSIPHRWRGRYNEDTDLCLQVLADGWCTVLVNAFMADKTRTMTIKGGNTEGLYDGDGRLKMSRALERQWPGVVTTRRRFKRPQHHIAKQWQAFTTPLKRRSDVDFAQLPSADEYGLTLRAVTAVEHPNMQRLLTDYKAEKDPQPPPANEVDLPAED